MPNVFNPASGQAKGISDLFWLVLGVATFVVLIVSVLVAYFGFKYRRIGNDDSEPKQVSENTKFEIIWTATPFVILVGLFVWMLFSLGSIDPDVSAQAAANPDVIVIGHQWWWEYRYPKLGIVTANELHIPTGQKLLLQFESYDVDHNWWVPQLGRKMDAIPGQINQMYVQADQPDVFHGACAEYCGTEHAWMLISVHAQSQADFNTWVKQQQTLPTIPAGDTAAQAGKQVFLNNTCASCHAINGTTANADVGPNLTHLMSRETLGTGIIQNTPQNLYKWVKDVQKIKAGVNMPSFTQLSDQDLNNLVAYLETLK